MRCAVYARVSTDRQDVQNSFARQLAACRAWAAAHGGKILEEHVYRDEAISGSTTIGRPELQKLLAILNRRGAPPFDALLVDDDSRLDRGGHLAELVAQFAARNVRVIACDSGRDLTDENETLLVHVKSGLNQHYLLELGRRTRAGLAQRVLHGYHAGGRIYGYRLIPEWPAGMPAELRTRETRLGTRIEVDRKQAALVREMFRRFAQGAGFRELALDLNRRGVPSARGGKWDITAVRAILRNPKYRGDWTWNTSRWRKKPEALLSDGERRRIEATGRHPRQCVTRPQADWIEVHREDLRVVSDRTWSAAADRFRENAGRTGKRPASSPLAGLIRCACGGPIVRRGGNARGERRLGCAWAANRGPTVCRNTVTVSEGAVLQAILEHIEREALTPDRVRRATEIVTREAKKAAKRARPGSLEAARQHVSDLETQIGRLVEAVEAGADVPAIRAKLLKRQAELDQARRDLAAAGLPGLLRDLRPITTAQVVRAVRSLRRRLRAGDDGVREALRAVVAAVTVARGQDGGWNLEVRTSPWAVGQEGPSPICGSGGALSTIGDTVYRAGIRFGRVVPLPSPTLPRLRQELAHVAREHPR